MVSKRKLFFISLLVLSAYFISCKREEAEPPPEASTLDSLLIAPLSVINVPVQYRISALEDMLNEKIKGMFVKKWMPINDKGDSVYLEISRKERIKLVREDRTLHASIPLFISGKFIAKVVGIKVKNATPVEADLVVHLNTKLHLDSAWNLVPETTIDTINWRKEPTIKVGFVNVNLKKPIENTLYEKEGKVIAKADSSLQQLMNTRKIVEKIWMDIQKPIRINKKGTQVWLKAYAEDLSGHVEDTEPDLLSLSFQLKAHTETLIEGDSIPPSNAALPPFVRQDATNDSLVIYVHSVIAFTHVNDLLNKELHDKELAASGFTTKIKKINVYGTPTGIAVQVGVKGDITGDLYLAGKPEFDTVAYTFGLKEFDFNLKSESALLNSADWLLHTTLLDLVKEKLLVDVRPIASKLPDLIMQGVEKGKSGEKIDINIDTLFVRPVAVLTTRDNIQTIVKANGRATLGLEEKIFAKKKKK